MLKTRTFILVKWHFISTQPMRRKLRRDLRACSVLLQPKVWGEKNKQTKHKNLLTFRQGTLKNRKTTPKCQLRVYFSGKKTQKTLPEN